MKVILYDEPTVPELNISALAAYMRKLLGCRIEVRHSFFDSSRTNASDNDKNYSFYKKLASVKFANPNAPFVRITPTEEEIKLENPSHKCANFKNIVMYEGYELLRILTERMVQIQQKQRDNSGNYDDNGDEDNFFHIVLTTRLPCTYDENDNRYHGRVIICSNPCIISTTGLIEAPAKPRRYYFKLLSNILIGVNTAAAKKEITEDYLEYGDPRISDALKGYVMQGLFYYITGDPFCDSKDCMLYNAHWQADMIHAQIHSGKLCNRHHAMFYDAIKKRFE